jgi:hypothetical protein
MRPEGIIGKGRSSNADNAIGGIDFPFQIKRGERGDQFSFCKIAGSAENDDCTIVKAHRFVFLRTGFGPVTFAIVPRLRPPFVAQPRHILHRSSEHHWQKKQSTHLCFLSGMGEGFKSIVPFSCQLSPQAER